MTASDPFGELMSRHIYKVVLLCTEYDQFLIEEDGRVEEELFREYTQLGLSNPRRLPMPEYRRGVHAPRHQQIRLGGDDA
jgi:hypothetical protein